MILFCFQGPMWSLGSDKVKSRINSKLHHNMMFVGLLVALTVLYYRACFKMHANYPVFLDHTFSVLEFF